MNRAASGLNRAASGLTRANGLDRAASGLNRAASGLTRANGLDRAASGLNRAASGLTRANGLDRAASSRFDRAASSPISPGSEQPLHRPPPIIEQPLPEVITALPSPGQAVKKGGNRNVLFFILAVAVGVVAVLGGFVLLQTPEESVAGEQDPAPGSQTADDGVDTEEAAQVVESTDTTGSSVNTTEVATSDEVATTLLPSTTEAPETTARPAEVPILLRPTGTGASRIRAAIGRLRCGGSNRFDPELLIDGDPNTGWGASDGDGSGEWIRIEFDQPVRIVEVGLTPGYLRVAPRSDQDCQSVSAFTFNRFIEEVVYTFDDRSTVRQRFDYQPTMQRKAIDEVVTENVWITIVSTQPSTDPDTIISDAEFYGFES